MHVQQPAVSSSPIFSDVSNSNVQKTTEMASEPKRINTKTFNSNTVATDNISKSWPKIVNDLKQNGKIVLYTNLINTTAVEMNDMIVGIEFPRGLTPFGKAVLEKPENVNEISKLVSMACGKEMQIKYINGNNQVHKLTNEEDLQNLANESDIPFNIIE